MSKGGGHLKQAGDEKARILIVDDEPANLDVLGGLLRSEYSVLIAKSGEQALARANGTLRPDLILLDVMMPGVDGFEVCRQLKADPRTRDIAVLFVTALGDVTDEATGLAIGAVDYLTKPITPAVLCARVKGVLDRLQLQRQLDTMKNQFQAMIVHDMRNPLSVISGFTELSLAQAEVKASPEIQRNLERIDANARRLLGMVQEMLELTELRGGKARLHRSDVDLTGMLSEIVEEQRLLALPKGITLAEELEPELVAWVDPHKIAGVVINLIGNALKFTPEGGRIGLTAQRREDRIVVSVSDTGPGISSEQAARVFAPWETLDHTVDRTAKGYGLGLAICRMTMEAHGGQIGVTAASGGGARFDLSFPIRQPGS